jgi:hypothetical protein
MPLEDPVKESRNHEGNISVEEVTLKDRMPLSVPKSEVNETWSLRNDSNTSALPPSGWNLLL